MATRILRGYHYCAENVLPLILKGGFKPREHGANAWGMGVYATLLEGTLKDDMAEWRDVRILIEAGVDEDKLVVITAESAEFMRDTYLTWSAENPAYAILVDIEDYTYDISTDIACQFRVPPETVAIVAYEDLKRGGMVYL